MILKDKKICHLKVGITFLSVWVSIYLHTSSGLLLTGYSISIYFVACFHFTHISLSSGMYLLPLKTSKSYCKEDNPGTIKTKKGKALFILLVMIRMFFSHLMQSEIIIYGLVRKCVKLSPFS